MSVPTRPLAQPQEPIANWSLPDAAKANGQKAGLELDEVSPVPSSGPSRTEAHPPSETITRIEPARGWHVVGLPEIWCYRELLGFLVWRDIKVRYKQTALGLAWAVLQPALMMVVFSVFFARTARLSSGGIPYPLFAYAGLLPWTLFATALANSAQSVVGSERLVTKIYFPRLIVPFASIGSAIVDFGMALSLLVVMMLFFQRLPGVELLLLPVLVLVIVLLAAGLGTALSALNVKYRDIKYVIPFAIQLGLFATPTVYMETSADQAWWVRLFCLLNPMTSFVATTRAALLGGPIAWGPLALAVVISIAAFIVGCLYFRSAEDGFADII